jgi:arylsulfatase A-like enzyme
MKAIILMFDSLNRHLLPPYGCDWVHAPNFRRLEERTATFDRSYVCSMPCMPARRELHTARPNFLHRSWGPLEPFDDSVPELLKNAGIYTHLTTDHYHYWEEGGANYMTRYNTHQMFRGQEGDAWMGQVANPHPPKDASKRNDGNWRQDWVNRQFMRREEEQPQYQTFAAGLDFLRRNATADRWLLQIETFDPHEPYFTQRHYKDLYPEHYRKYQGRHFDWPQYGKVSQSRAEVEHCRHENAALVSMCDRHLGDVLDLMDELNLWDDTMLIVWTDHGFLLGEHDCWAKCWLPFYEEISHTPFFVWDPRSRQRGVRRQALVQPSLDIGPTLLRYFGLKPTADMLGQDLAATVANDQSVRQAALFGLHGGQVNVTDGRYVYMRGSARADNEPLFNYTLAPSHMRHTWGPEEFRPGHVTLAPPFSFTKGAQTLRVSATGWYQADRDARGRIPTQLFDLKADPHQRHPLKNARVETQMTNHLVRLMQECDAPAEQYERLGLRADTVGQCSATRNRDRG